MKRDKPSDYANYEEVVDGVSPDRSKKGGTYQIVLAIPKDSVSVEEHPSHLRLSIMVPVDGELNLGVVREQLVERHGERHADTILEAMGEAYDAEVIPMYLRRYVEHQR